MLYPKLTRIALTVFVVTGLLFAPFTIVSAVLTYLFLKSAKRLELFRTSRR